MKKLLLIIFVLAMALSAFAQTDVTIGTGTSTGRYPFNDYYVYSRSQCIYLESEIGAPGTIHKLRWFRNDTGADASAIGTTQIWLKTVSNAVMTDANWEDPGTMVAEIANIDLGAGNAWYEVDITDFVYAGGNLLVSVYTQNAPYTSPHSYWRYTATTGFNRCRLGNSDSVNPPTMSLSTLRPNIQINMTTGAPTTAPNAPILASPGNGAWTFTGSSLVWNSGGGFPSTYDVYFGTSATPPLVSDNQAGTSYTPTLAAGTTYYWNVVATNGFGDSPASATWSFKVPTTTQLAESFENTTFPPAGWANPGTWSRSTSYYKHGTASAYKYGSTSTAYVLSTPRLTITGTSTLDIWSLASGTTGTLQVVYSSDRVTWTPLGAPITHAATYTFYNTVADLSSLAGNNYYLGIQTGLQAVSYYVDLVIGPEITPEAPGAVTLSTPADLAINVSEYPVFTWTAPTTGGVPTGYAVYCSTSNPPNYTTDLIGSTTGALTFTATTALAYNTTYYWTVKAYNAAGDGPVAPVRSFTTRANPTISTFPWEVNFGTLAGDWPVLNWSQLTGQYGTALTAGTRWYQDDFVNVTAPLNKAAKMNIWSANFGWLITPPIAIPASGYELKFDIGLTAYGATTAVTPAGQPDDKFMVLVDDNPNMTSPTILREWNNTGSPYVYDNVSNTGENHILDLDAYTGTVYFAFYGESATSNGDNDFFVDNVIVRESPAAPIFTYAPTAIDFGMVMQNAAAPAQNVVITNTGGGTLNIGTADLAMSGTNASMFTIDTSNLPETLAGGESVVIPVSVYATAEGLLSATLTITNNQTRTEYPVALSATGLPAGIMVIGNGTADLDLPINVFFGYTYSQSIFMQSEINVPDQRIESVYYYWNGVEADTLSNDWTIYMGHTALTAFDTTTSWIPLANLSQVFNGEVALPATAGWIEIPLTSPFIYNNTDNLVIAVDENEPSYGSNSNYFYGTADATNRSLRYYSDSTNPDPAAPVAGTQILGYPNVMLQFGDIPVGGPDPVTVTYPAPEATELPLGGFDITWTPASTGGIPDYYAVYMSQDEATIYDDLYFETSNTTFNPVTDGGITFNYLDRYYYTIQAFNGDGDALIEPALWFEIEAAPSIITTFPWNETFDTALTVPDDWTMVDVDAGGTSWVGTTTYTHSAPNAFKHGYSTAVPDPGQNGWLITPAVQVPAGNYYLSWWNYNVYPTWMVYNGVKVNTTNDPAAAGWTEIWSQATAASAWSQAVVNISAYAGQTVYFAFNYQGYDGDDWYIDDVSVYELLVDTFGPVITTLPHINTPREDLSYLVYAEIADDATWNNPIGGANLYYSIDAGATWSAPVAMTLDVAPGYYAYIPAQALGTSVQYYIQAWDSLNNMTTTDTFTFGVNDPTWIWYDQGGTTYLGYTTTNFGPTVLFNNPFYGTGNAMQLLGTDGSSYYGNAANLQVSTFDGTTITPYFTTPIPVTFGAQTYETFDLTSYNVQISTEYFLVSYLDVPMGNYILFDSTYDYGTTYVYQGTTLYTMSNSGSWCIGAQVQTGASLALDAPVVTVATGLTGIDLSWGAVDGANGYKVLASSDPYAADPWAELAYITGTSYTYTGTDDLKFFKVRANSDAPTTRNNQSILSAPARINVPASKATNMPKGSFSTRNRK